MRLCLVCEAEIVQKPCESAKYFATKKFCTYKCYWVDKKGKALNEKQKAHIDYLHENFKTPHLGMKHSVESRIKMSAATSKIPVSEWTGFKEEANRAFRKSWPYRQWRAAVVKRDNGICQFCFAVDVKINADHIKPFSKFPDLRLEVNNGRTLCVPCHKELDALGRRVEKISFTDVVFI